MNDLHAEVARTMMDEMQGYRDRGEPVPPALLSAITKFLKDNHIEALALPNSPVERLKSSLALPFTTDLQ
jgi:hypothetical protein